MDIETWSLKARLVLPVDSPPIDNGVVEIHGERIIGVRRGGSATHDLGDVCLMPGLVNAHTHLDLTGFPRTKEPPASFAAWITQVIRHRQAEGENDRMRATFRGIQQSIGHGVTLLGDISVGGTSLRLLAGIPLAATVYFEILGAKKEKWQPALRACSDWIENPNGNCDVKKGISPHAPYSTCYDLFSWAGSRSEPIQVHLAETDEEIEWMTTRTGPLATMLEQLGLGREPGLATNTGTVLDWLRRAKNTRDAGPVGLIHCNRLSPGQLSNLGPKAAIIHCPRTHAWFRRGNFPLAKMVESGVKVALGTDGEASAPDLNLLEEARTVFLAHPSVPPAEILRMATLNGAGALGWEGETGSLVAGKFADIIVMPLSETRNHDFPEEQILGGVEKPLATLWHGFWRPMDATDHPFPMTDYLRLR